MSDDFAYGGAVEGRSKDWIRSIWKMKMCDFPRISQETSDYSQVSSLDFFHGRFIRRCCDRIERDCNFAASSVVSRTSLLAFINTLCWRKNLNSTRYQHACVFLTVQLTERMEWFLFSSLSKTASCPMFLTGWRPAGRGSRWWEDWYHQAWHWSRVRHQGAHAVFWLGQHAQACSLLRCHQLHRHHSC